MGKQFEGYDPLRYTQVPDAVFDDQLSQLSHAELKVLLWIVRCTFGWKKQSDSISLSQLEKATGLSRRAVSAATKTLEAGKHIVIERGVAAKGGAKRNVYGLRIREDRAESASQKQGG